MPKQGTDIIANTSTEKTTTITTTKKYDYKHSDWTIINTTYILINLDFITTLQKGIIDTLLTNESFSGG